MSLINQMLRDLEARRSAEMRTANSPLSGLTTGAAGFRRGSWRMLGLAGGLLLVAAVIGGVLWYQLRSAPAIPQPMVAAPAVPPAPPAARAEPPASPPPAAITRAPTPAATILTPIPAAAPQPAPEPVIIEKRERPLDPHQQAAALYQQAYVLLQRGRHDEAEIILREALRKAPDHLQAHEALAGLLLGAGRQIEAAELLESGIRLHPNHPTFALLYARLRLEQGDEAGALRVLEQGVAYATERADYLAFLAAVYQRASRYRDSIAAYRQALDLDGGQAAWWAGLGISLEAVQEQEEARQAYRRALAGRLPEQLARYVRDRLAALADGETR